MKNKSKHQKQTIQDKLQEVSRKIDFYIDKASDLDPDSTDIVAELTRCVWTIKNLKEQKEKLLYEQSYVKLKQRNKAAVKSLDQIIRKSIGSTYISPIDLVQTLRNIREQFTKK